ncbi:MAG TPA: hypothetical protein DF383_07800, partial [Deltaproteobacteria bacterium]|nr:hypothetical protein [Deltaproteobacteria bacterium]
MSDVPSVNKTPTAGAVPPPADAKKTDAVKTDAKKTDAKTAGATPLDWPKEVKVWNGVWGKVVTATNKNGEMTYMHSAAKGFKPLPPSKSTKIIPANQQKEVEKILRGVSGNPPRPPGPKNPGEKPPPEGADYPTDLLPVESHLKRLGIHPAIFFKLNPPPKEAKKTARSQYIDDILAVPEGSEGNAQMLRRLGKSVANQWREFYLKQGIKPELAYANLQARGDIRQDKDAFSDNLKRSLKIEDVPLRSLPEIITSQQQLEQLDKTGLGATPL